MKTTNKQAGFSLIELLIVVAIIGIIAAIAIPNLLASRRAANESAAKGTLRTITSAEATYQSTTGGGQYADSAGLGSAKLIDSVLGSAGAKKSGYTFTVTVPGSGQFEATAAAESASAGSFSYYTDEAGVIYQTAGTSAGSRGTPGTPVK